MPLSVIRDPGTGGLVRIQPNICDRYNSIANGSILIVPAGTTAFVTINGELSRPYGPGRYQLFTGVDPFFIRLRNILTEGDTGTSVSVIFISNQKINHMQTGTGEIPFKEKRFSLTMKAFAAINLAYSIGQPLRFAEKLVGTYSSDFSQEDLDPFITNQVLTHVRQALAIEMGSLDITTFNSNLNLIRNRAAEPIRSSLNEFGLKIEHFDVVSVNVSAEEMRRLHHLEEEYASGKTRTDIELDNLQRVWNGNVSNRMMSEMLTGLPSRGQAPLPSNQGTHSGSGAMTPLVQMMMLSQMLPMLREPFNTMTQHTDVFGQTQRTSQQGTSSADAPPPIPSRYKRCPSCNGEVDNNKSSCPICGYRF